MKIDLKGITAEDISFKLNRVKLNPQEKLDMKPQFSRQVRKVKENDKLNFVALSVKIESTDAEPKPYDVHLTLVGIFEVTDVNGDKDERAFVIEATSILYAYLRAALTNLTANAFVPPLMLPVITGPIFPEDRDSVSFNFGNSDIN